LATLILQSLPLSKMGSGSEVRWVKISGDLVECAKAVCAQEQVQEEGGVKLLERSTVCELDAEAV
jgi:hypothetical protein